MPLYCPSLSPHTEWSYNSNNKYDKYRKINKYIIYNIKDWNKGWVGGLR
jgi:hypothetical protein